MATWWPKPEAGEVVWCRFPTAVLKDEKSRPALIVTVFDDDDPQFFVRVAYGTSQRTRELHAGEFAILAEVSTEAYAAAGLSYDTKFNFKQVVELRYNDDWFIVPPHAPNGQVPKLGILHPSLMRLAQAAHTAANRPA